MILPTSLASVARVAWPPFALDRKPALPPDAPVVVTAFFDIGRGEWGSRGDASARFQRGAEAYFNSFAHLSRLRNKLVVVTEPRFVDRVVALRRANGLEDATAVIEINDLFDSEPVATARAAIARRMTDLLRSWVRTPDSPEYWEPRYVLVNALKAAFVCAAADLGLIEAEQTAWVDFGYCRDDACFDASIPWRYDAQGKINLFHMLELDDVPIYRVVRSGTVYFQGCHILAPTREWSWFSTEISAALTALLDADLVDDDQTLMLMAWRKSPERFRIHPNRSDNWRTMLRNFRVGEPTEPAPLRRGPTLRVESPLREELRFELKRWEKWFKTNLRRRFRFGP